MSDPKRIIIKDAIEAGGATKESLMEVAECSAASLATNFTYLRLMGFYPVKDEDGTYSFVTEEEWEEIQTERKANAKTRKPAKAKTPEEALAAAQKRYARCEKAAANAAERKERSPNEELVILRHVIAQAEFKLAYIALRSAEASVAEYEASVAEYEALR
jgi:FtsZ-interacting cell division protein ZipA